MRMHSESSEMTVRLRHLMAELDGAIQQAIQNPLLLADSPMLVSIESECASLKQQQANQNGETTAEEESGKRADLVWEIRARAGRLQRLLDSASHFYSTCFSSQQSFSWQQADGLAYGMHGEWGGVASASHLSVDC